MTPNRSSDSCTTILVGKGASYDGSTIVARTEDSQNGVFTPKKFIVVQPEDQPRHYRSVLSPFEIDLPDNPVRYTAVPDAIPKDGIWGEAGINHYNVAMSETETITTNSRVLGADPLVESGIGEEDMLTLVLPYVQSAREGVLRLGKLLEEYGTYESNPNQLGSDRFEFDRPEEFLCDPDLKDFVERHHLALDFDGSSFNPRYAFGSQRDKDRHYNTPRAWDIQRFLNPEVEQDPRSFFLPWCQKPYRKITIEDVKYVLSSHYQDSVYDPYGSEGDAHSRRTFRTIGINRTSQTAILQLRPNRPQETTGIQWLCYGAMPFNTAVPFFTQVDTTPDYFANTTEKVTTDSFYWTNRIIAGLADAHYSHHVGDLEDYQERTMALGHARIGRVDQGLAAGQTVDFERENQEMSDQIQEATDRLLDKILLDASNLMTNHFSLSD